MKARGLSWFKFSDDDQTSIFVLLTVFSASLAISFGGKRTKPCNFSRPERELAPIFGWCDGPYSLRGW
jgi:hypothetical protein